MPSAVRGPAHGRRWEEHRCPGEEGKALRHRRKVGHTYGPLDILSPAESASRQPHRHRGPAQFAMRAGASIVPPRIHAAVFPLAALLLTAPVDGVVRSALLPPLPRRARRRRRAAVDVRARARRAAVVQKLDGDDERRARGRDRRGGARVVAGARGRHRVHPARRDRRGRRRAHRADGGALLVAGRPVHRDLGAHPVRDADSDARRARGRLPRAGRQGRRRPPRGRPRRAAAEGGGAVRPAAGAVGAAQPRLRVAPALLRPRVRQGVPSPRRSSSAPTSSCSPTRASRSSCSRATS